MIVFHHIAAVADGHRHHGRTGFGGNAERTALELANAAFLAFIAGAFGENAHRAALLYLLGGLIQRPQAGTGIAAVHIHTVQKLHPAAHQRNFFHLGLAHQCVRPVQAGEHKRNIIIAAVVGHKHAGHALGNVFAAFHLHADPCAAQKLAAPVRHMPVHQLVHTGLIARFQRLQAAVQIFFVQDHIPEKVYKPCDRSQNIHLFPHFPGFAPVYSSIVPQFGLPRRISSIFFCAQFYKDIL